MLVAILGLRSGLALGGFGEFGGVRIVVMEKRTWVGSYSRYIVSMQISQSEKKTVRSLACFSELVKSAVSKFLSVISKLMLVHSKPSLRVLSSADSLGPSSFRSCL